MLKLGSASDATSPLISFTDIVQEDMWRSNHRLWQSEAAALALGESKSIIL